MPVNPHGDRLQPAPRAPHLVWLIVLHFKRFLHSGWRKWAPVLGLTAQLFWIGHALTSDPIAWGILGLVVLYGAGWYAGLRREWKPRPNGETA